MSFYLVAGISPVFAVDVLLTGVVLIVASGASALMFKLNSQLDEGELTDLNAQSARKNYLRVIAESARSTTSRNLVRAMLILGVALTTLGAVLLLLNSQ